MRLSSLCLTSVLFSPFVFAQHTTSAPPPPPAAHSAPSSPHISAPPAPHISAPAAAPSHVSSASTTHSAPAANKLVDADHKIAGDEKIRNDGKIKSDEKIASAPGVGEDSRKENDKNIEDKKEEKSDPDLRRRICAEGECKVTKKEPAPEPAPEPDLRRRVCVDGKCACPAGEAENKGACVPTTVSHTPACDPGSPGCLGTCPAGQVWNGATCAPVGNHCAPGQIWNGASCLANCSILTTQAQSLITELRSAHQDRDAACRQDSGGMSCTEATGRYATTLSEYQNLLGGAAPECRTQVPDPSTV